jgi:hypothetical protein
VGRLRWFMVGAAATAGALVAAPTAYNRLRGLVETSAPPMLPPASDWQPPAPPPHAEPATTRPAAAFAGYEAPAAEPNAEETAELRLRIDETRDRIRKRAQDGLAADDEE